MQGKPTQNVKYSWDALQETPTCRKPARKKRLSRKTSFGTLCWWTIWRFIECFGKWSLPFDIIKNHFLQKHQVCYRETGKEWFPNTDWPNSHFLSAHVKRAKGLAIRSYRMLDFRDIQDSLLSFQAMHKYVNVRSYHLKSGKIIMPLK